MPQAGDLLRCRALASGVGQCGSHASSDSERPRGIRNGRAGDWQPSRALKQELREAINQAALAGGVSYLSKEDRQIALGLAINWGMRLLLAYALECPSMTRSNRKDLPWIADLAGSLLTSSTGFWQLWPVLRAVKDARNFHGVLRDLIDHDVRQR